MSNAAGGRFFDSGFAFAQNDGAAQSSLPVRGVILSEAKDLLRLDYLNGIGGRIALRFFLEKV